MDNLIKSAKEFSHWAHDSLGQKRTYTGLPYWTHTDAVAEVVAAYTDNNFAIAAAHLHDVFEDIPCVTLDSLVNKFGKDVARLVVELTDVYTKERFPLFNREKRKAFEAARLGVASYYARLIKAADILDNSKSILEHDIVFAGLYLKEKARVLYAIQRGLPEDLLKKI